MFFSFRLMLTIGRHENYVLGGLWISCSDHSSWNIVSHMLGNRNRPHIQCKMSRDATSVSNLSPSYVLWQIQEVTLLSAYIWYTIYLRSILSLFIIIMLLVYIYNVEWNVRGSWIILLMNSWSHKSAALPVGESSTRGVVSSKKC